MEINTCKTLIAIARANIPEELLGDILVPAVGLRDRKDYWNQATARLVLAFVCTVACVPSLFGPGYRLAA